MSVTLRRLLIPLGGGSFTATVPPPTPGPTDLGADGFWNQVSGPRAAYYNGKTYICWTNDAGDIYVAQFVHSTELLSTPVLLTSGAPAVDGTIHVAPCILVRSSDRRIMVSVVANGGTHRPSVWISTNPEDATAFPAGADIGAAGVYTYTSLTETDEGIYLWVGRWISGSRRMGHYKSTDGGSTWGSFVTVMRPAVDSSFFWHFATDGDRIDIYATDTDRDTPSSIYHFIFEGDAIFDSDMNSLGALPVFSDEGTLVKDGSEGSVGASGATYDGGEAATVLYTDIGVSTLIHVARWDGAAWQVDEVADSNGLIGGNPNIATAAIAEGDANTVWMPIKVGSHFELFVQESPDDGATWNGTQLTSGSAFDHAMPEAVKDANASLPVVWGFGTYTNDDDFDFSIYALTP